jgi:hypothetical protein
LAGYQIACHYGRNCRFLDAGYVFFSRWETIGANGFRDNPKVKPISASPGSSLTGYFPRADEERLTMLADTACISALQALPKQNESCALDRESTVHARLFDTATPNAWGQQMHDLVSLFAKCLIRLLGIGFGPVWLVLGNRMTRQVTWSIVPWWHIWHRPSQGDAHS